MQNLYTLREMSAAIAKVENRNDEERIFQQLRGASARALLVHQDTYGPKGALRFALQEVALARVILRALDSGVESGNLKTLRNDLRIERRIALPDGSHVVLSITEATQTAGLAQWDIEVVQHRDIKTGKTGQLVHWIRNGNRHGVPNPRNSNTFIPGATIEETRIIHFSTLVAPIIAQLTGD